MNDKLQDDYKKGLQFIESNYCNLDDISGCKLENDSNQITVSSIENLNNQNSLLPCKSMYKSEYYNNSALINAFNVLQSKISLMRDIYEQRDNPHAVWLCDQGEWKPIIVNDKVPCIISDNQTFQSMLKCEYKWPIIIEKAVVKLLGASYNSFNHLMINSIQSFIYILIGSPITKIQINEFDELKQILGQNNSILYIELQQNENCYAYVIQSIQYKNEKQYVKLQAVNAESIPQDKVDKKESKFELEWNQVKTYNIYQIHLNSNYKTFTFTMQNPLVRQIQFLEHTYIYSFQIEDSPSQDYWFSICQRDQNFNYSKQNFQIKYGLIRFFLFRHKKQGYQFISEFIESSQNLYVKTELKRGNYTLVCQAEFYNLDSLNQEVKNLQTTLKLQIQANQLPKNFNQTNQNEGKLKELIISMIRQNSTNQNTIFCQDQGFPKVEKSSDKTKGFMYFYYENHGDTDFQDNFRFGYHQNLINYETQQMEIEIQINVKPQCYQLVLYKFDPRVLLQFSEITFQYDFIVCPQLQNYQILEIPQVQNNQIVYSQLQNEQPNLTRSTRESLFKKIYDQKDLKQPRIENPEIFIKQHKKGVVFLFMNKTDNELVGECLFSSLKNLSVYFRQQTSREEKIKFKIDPRNYTFIFLNSINPKINKFNYKMRISILNQNQN